MLQCNLKELAKILQKVFVIHLPLLQLAQIFWIVYFVRFARFL